MGQEVFRVNQRDTSAFITAVVGAFLLCGQVVSAGQVAGPGPVDENILREYAGAYQW